MRWVVLALSLTAGPAVAAEGQPYGCWSIRDQVERLACFDMALGPPASGQEGDAALGGDRKAGASDPILQPSGPDHR